MTWITSAISIILISAIIFEYRVKYVDKDGRTLKHKCARRIVLGLAIISILAQQGISEIREYRRSKAAKALSGKVDEANANIKTLRDQNSELLTALGTNTSVAPQLRLTILEHSRAVELVSSDVSELEQWKTDFRNEQAVRKQKQDAAILKRQMFLAEEQAAAQGRVDQAWKRATQCYDFIVRTLQETVQSIAKSKGDKVYSDYAGLPPLPMGDKGAHIASITTGTNLGWFFQVSAEGIPRNNSAEVWLRVFGFCTNRAGAGQVLYSTVLGLSENSGTNVSITSHLHYTPNQVDFSQAFNLESYQTNVKAWVRRFVGAQATKCESP